MTRPTRCRWCGDPIQSRTGSGRPRVYCSRKCSSAWRHRQPHARESRAARQRVVAVLRERERREGALDLAERGRVDLDGPLVADLLEVLDHGPASLLGAAKRLGWSEVVARRVAEACRRAGLLRVSAGRRKQEILRRTP